MDDSQLVIGTWGEAFILVADLKSKQLKLLSPEEIMEDKYGNPFFPKYTMNKFVNGTSASVFLNGKWVYVIRSRMKLIEIGRKLSNLGYPFEINPNLKNFIKKASTATDITFITDLPILALVR